MCFKTRLFVLTICVAVASIMLICPFSVLQAQTPSPTPTDPGARPTGNEPVNSDPNAVCPINALNAPTKFPETPCIDFVQPPSPNVTADGAGNIISNSSNLGPLWFQALLVFSTPASVDGSDASGSTSSPTPLTTPFIKGLGPSFNAESCFHCHSQPAVGGSSPGCVVDAQVSGGQFCSPLTANANGTPTSFFSSTTNPQVLDGEDRGSTNGLPDFITDRQPTGPIVEVRFPAAVGAGPSTLGNPASVPKGAVAEIFTIAGRSDTKAEFGNNCNILQEVFQAQENVGNIIFRIPIPTFGDGFVENTPETALAGAATTAAGEAGSTTPTAVTDIKFGIFNLSGNDSTITRFGWKAQNKSLLMFSGEASNVEMGVTNELFPTERTYGNAPNCTDVLQSNGTSQNQLPEDVTLVLTQNQISQLETLPPSGSTVSVAEPVVSSVITENIENDAVFMRLNGAPSICNYNSGVNSSGFALCKTVDASVKRGAALFGNSLFAGPEAPFSPGIGCVLCHWQQFTTAASANGSLNNQPFSPFSDFALHHMGGLADNVQQGSALGDQFRTAPLWGLGQRLFFLHDGREPQNPVVANENPLYNVIQDHCLPVPNGSAFQASEACTVVANFNSLPAQSVCAVSGGVTTCTSSQQDIMNFLRSL